MKRFRQVNAAGCMAAVLFFAANCGAASAADGFGYAGAKIWGGAAENHAKTVTIGPGGSLYVGGMYHGTTDFDPGPAADTRTTLDDTSSFVTKFNSDGSYAWTRTSAGGYSATNSLAVDADGNVYAVGRFWGTTDFDPGPATDFRSTSWGDYNSFLVRYNADGSYAWTKTWIGNASQDARGVAVDLNGNVYVTGYFSSTVDFDPGPGTDVRSGDLYIIKYDSSGNYLWAKTPPGSGYGRGAGAATDADGNLYVVGNYGGTVDFDPGAGTDERTSIAYDDAFLTKYNSDGSYGWTKTWGGIGNDEASHVTVDASGDLYLAGSFAFEVDFDPDSGTDNRTAGGSSDVFLAKYAADGSYLWTRAWGASGYDTISRIAIDGSGGLFATGSFSGVVDFDAGAGSDLRDGGVRSAYLVKYDQSGGYRWTKVWGGQGRAVALHPSGSAFVAGVFSGTVDLNPGLGTDLQTAATYSAFLSQFSTAYTISGTVTLGGSALAGVSIDGGPIGAVATDGLGFYAFPDIAAGTVYTLTPYKAGHTITPGSRTGTLANAATADFTALVNNYDLSGTVTSGGAPVAGAVVDGGSLGRRTTDTNGRYVFAALPYGTAYTLTISKFGWSFAPSSVSGTIGGDETSDFSSALLDSDADGITDIQEVSDGTNPNDRGSSLPVLGAAICSEWNGFLNGTMWNIMEHVNMTSTLLQVRSVLYDADGRPQGTTELLIPPGGQQDLLAHSIAGWRPQAYGKVCSTAVNGGSGALDGRMIYYKPVDGAGSSFEFAFAMPFLNGMTGVQFVPFNTFQPSLDPADAGNLVANWIQLTNLESNRQSGTMTFYSADGSVLGSFAAQFEAGARQDFSGHLFGKNVVGLIKWHPDSGGARFQLRNIRYFYDNPGSADSFVTAFQIEGLSGNGELITVPLDTSAGTAVLEVANTSDSGQDIAVNIYRDDGTWLASPSISLPPHGSVHIIADPILAGRNGLATVKGSVPAGVVAVAMQYGRTRALGLRNMYGIAAAQPLGSVLRSSYNTYLNQSCRLILLNPADSAAGASVSMIRSDGYRTLSDEQLAVPAHGRTDYDACANERPDYYGVLTVNPTAANTMIGWVIRQGTNDDYRFPTPVRQ